MESLHLEISYLFVLRAEVYFWSSNFFSLILPTHKMRRESYGELVALAEEISSNGRQRSVAV